MESYQWHKLGMLSSKKKLKQQQDGLFFRRI